MDETTAQLQHERRITEIESRSKSNTHRLNAVEENLKENTDLIVAIKEMAVETKHMREDLNSTIKRLEKLEKSGVDKWDKFKWLIVAGLVTLIMGYIAVSIGLK